MNREGTYEVKRIPKSREIVIEAVEQSRRLNHVLALIELDVSKAREFIRSHKEKTGERLSFTAWIMKCIAQGIDENKQVQALKKGRKKIVIFDDVDIKCMVEKEIGGKKVPIGYIVRKANRKSFREIHNEIRAVQSRKIETDEQLRKKEYKSQNWFMSLPKVIRKIIWRKLNTDPFLVQKNLGTVGITSLGMFAKKIAGWAITKSPHSLNFALGGMELKPVVIGDKVEYHEFICMTIMFNHDVVDGGPAVRFIARLGELVQEGFGLID